MVVSFRNDLYMSLCILKKCSTMRWELKPKVIKLIVISNMVLLGFKKDSNFDLDEITEFVKS